MSGVDHLAEAGFEQRSRDQLAKPFQRKAIPAAVDGTVRHMHALFADHDREALRAQGEAIRAYAVAHAAELISQLADQLEANGVTVHFAGDGAEARAIITSICRDADANLIVKSKSMLSEEIELNDSLEQAGLRVVETDLGEYVVQLADDRPSHIIGPIIHKTRGEVRELFSKQAGRDLPDDAAALTAYARGALRQEFLNADVGITGANFAVAETGTIVLVENEGNARLCTALPRVHIAIVGAERVVPRLSDLAVLVPLLVGHATGQRVSTYLSLINGPRRADEPDGPEAQHVVIIDNGRSAILGTPYQSVLQCIRCGACQNICPVYRQVGGHAYGWVYGGPIGAVLTPLLRPSPAASELAHASSLCAACDDVCPVKIPLHDLLLGLRRDRVANRSASRVEAVGFRLWSYLWSTPFGYRASARVGRVATRITIGPLRRFAAGRTAPRPDAHPFYRDADHGS
jgi:L-lactate dehydrogenase complex protein LldF